MSRAKGAYPRAKPLPCSPHEPIDPAQQTGAKGGRHFGTAKLGGGYFPGLQHPDITALHSHGGGPQMGQDGPGIRQGGDSPRKASAASDGQIQEMGRFSSDEFAAAFAGRKTARKKRTGNCVERSIGALFTQIERQIGRWCGQQAEFGLTFLRVLEKQVQSDFSTLGGVRKLARCNPTDVSYGLLGQDQQAGNLIKK